MTNSSTVEGEHTIQDVQDEDEQTLNIESVTQESPEESEKTEDSLEKVSASEPDVVETYSSNLRPNEDEIQLLRLKLEEVSLSIWPLRFIIWFLLILGSM